MNNRALGNSGEDIACRYLEENGYEILERNRHFGRNCEIDIIAKLKKKLIFVEVKTRKSNNFGAPFEAVTKTKYENLVKGVQFYLKENPYKDCQIDVIGITLMPKLKIEHLKNIYL
ncbi:MAG: YraN family protein [Heliobacteriaceae bacterium]|jgi:putative endonuclease|nr:YraN family protein [Heliobacteriaceae bacterium]